jgi:hypothetical protein
MLTQNIPFTVVDLQIVFPQADPGLRSGAGLVGRSTPQDPETKAQFSASNAPNSVILPTNALQKGT